MVSGHEGEVVHAALRQPMSQTSLLLLELGRYQEPEHGQVERLEGPPQDLGKGWKGPSQDHGSLQG